MLRLRRLYDVTPRWLSLSLSAYTSPLPPSLLGSACVLLLVALRPRSPRTLPRVGLVSRCFASTLRSAALVLSLRLPSLTPHGCARTLPHSASKYNPATPALQRLLALVAAPASVPTSAFAPACVLAHTPLGACPRPRKASGRSAPPPGCTGS
nr:MAG TPA: hypothetical protein [Caudoviricetes sp.]